jgi:hypothetical protein
MFRLSVRGMWIREGELIPKWRLPPGMWTRLLAAFYLPYGSGTVLNREHERPVLYYLIVLAKGYVPTDSRRHGVIGRVYGGR